MFSRQNRPPTMFWLQLNQLATSLLSDAVGALFDMAHSADVDISRAEVIISISGNTPTGDVDRALLRVPYSIAARVQVDNTDGPVSFTVNLRDFHADLSRGGDDHRLDIHGFEDKAFIIFVTINSETGEMSLFPLGITQAHAERIIPELDYQYRAIIVIPSEDFRHVITNLQHTGNSAVSVHASDVEVKFFTQNQEVVYRTELGECVIAGVHPGHPVSWSFSLHFLTVILYACFLSDSVWLLHSDDAPPMLNFPVGSIGNLMLYLH